MTKLVFNKPKMRHKLTMNKTIHYFWDGVDEFVVNFNAGSVKMGLGTPANKNNGKNQIRFVVTWPKVKE